MLISPKVHSRKFEFALIFIERKSTLFLEGLLIVILGVTHNLF